MGDEDEQPAKGESPPLWGICMHALICCILSYGLPHIRQLARKKTKSLGDDPDAIEKMLDLPISVPDLVQVLTDNAKLLKGSLGNKSFAFYLDSIELLEKEFDRSEARGAQLVVCDDENSKDLIYIITVNAERRSITVAFRGSVTIGDWLADIDPFIHMKDNPFASEPGQSKKIGIQHGFYSDLYGKKKGEKTSKSDVIINHLTRLLEEHPGYGIVITGHSLGGALATSFAFTAAQEDSIPKPVICVTVAGPKAGNPAFCKAFERLENKGDIRYLRVVNDKDVVPTMPDRYGAKVCCDALSPQLTYQHPGTKLLFYREGDKKYELKKHADGTTNVSDKVTKDSVGFFQRSGEATGYFATCFCRGKNAPMHHDDVAENHGCHTYMGRLTDAHGDLKDLTFDDIYASEKK